MRDYKHETGMDDKELSKRCANSYGKEPFRNLSGQIEKFNNENRSRVSMRFEKYDVSDSGENHGLLRNLLNTEIDIVLETPEISMWAKLNRNRGLEPPEGMSSFTS